MGSMVRKTSVLLKQLFILGPSKIMATLALMRNGPGYKTEVSHKSTSYYWVEVKRENTKKNSKFLTYLITK